MAPVEEHRRRIGARHRLVSPAVGCARMTAITACRSCGSVGLQPVLSLGAMPLANALISPEDLDATEARYPLDVVLCPACALVQITETVPPEQLFSQYLYFTSYSDTMVRHAAAFVDQLVDARSLN